MDEKNKNEISGIEENLINDLLDTDSQTPWPQNLYIIIFGENKEIALPESAEGVFLEALGTLTPREEVVMRLRYKEQKSLVEIAEELNTTWDDVHAVESTAIRKLRHPKMVDWWKTKGL